MKYIWRFIGIVFLVFTLVFIFSVGSAIVYFLNPPEEHLSKKSVLYLKLEGVIMDGEDFLEHLREYRDNKDIKGVLIRVDSPGGVVAPSQELYAEIKKVRDKFKKPVVVSGGSLIASGAYYASVAADKIIVNPGTMVGSIGVLLEFVNLEKLYQWAKVERYALTTGELKDAGAEYKALSPNARKVFQNLIDNVYQQFLKAVHDGRKLDMNLIKANADGRVLTGEMAVQLGFADQIGTFDDAKKAIGEMTGLGDDPELFEPPKKRKHLQDYLEGLEGRFQPEKTILEKWLKLKTMGAPLFLLPGVSGL